MIAGAETPRLGIWALSSLIAAIAVLFNLAIPAVSLAVRTRRRARLMRSLTNGLPCAITDAFRDKLGLEGKTLESEALASKALASNTLSTNGPAAVSCPTSIPAKHTTFMQLRANGRIQLIRWDELLSVSVGTPVLLFAREGGRYACLLHGGKDRQEAERAIARASEEGAVPERPDPIKPISLAFGAFLQFLIFLRTLTTNGMDAIAILSLVAVFARALPWCPPGLILTVTAHSMSARGQGRKKSRRERAAGFIVAGTGVLLNLVLIFLAILGRGIPIVHVVP